MITKISILAWNAQNGIFPEHAEIEKLRNDIPFEIEKLISHIEGLEPVKMINSLERNVDKLFFSYFSLDNLISKTENRDKYRPVKNLIYETIIYLLSSAERELEICCSSTFIDGWIKRVKYFPFGDSKEKTTVPKGILKKDKDAFEAVQLLKSQLAFIDLFKPEYTNKIPAFKAWLKRERFINGQNEVSTAPTNLARVYYLLENIGIVYPSTSKKAVITAFFKEFSVKVVETINKKDNTRQVARKTVTNENATNCELLVSNDQTGAFYKDALESLTHIFNK